MYRLCGLSDSSRSYLCSRLFCYLCARQSTYICTKSSVWVCCHQIHFLLLTLCNWQAFHILKSAITSLEPHFGRQSTKPIVRGDATMLPGEVTSMFGTNTTKKWVAMWWLHGHILPNTGIQRSVLFRVNEFKAWMKTDVTSYCRFQHIHICMSLNAVSFAYIKAYSKIKLFKCHFGRNL